MKKKNNLPLLGIVMVLLGFGAPRANADFVTESDSVFGNASVVLDTHTGLYWLKPTETAGLSYSTVQSGIAAGLTGHFGYASSAQVHTLFSDAGITDFTNQFSAASYAGASAIVSEFGQTSAGSFPTGQSYTGSYTEVDGVFSGNYDAYSIAWKLNAAGAFGCLSATCAESSISTISSGGSAGAPYGSWLVATSLDSGSAPPPVPLPASLWLLLSGVGALGLRVRREADEPSARAPSAARKPRRTRHGAEIPGKEPVT